MHKLPGAVAAKEGFQVIVGVADGIARTAVTDFQVENIRATAVDKLMAIARPAMREANGSG